MEGRNKGGVLRERERREIETEGGSEDEEGGREWCRESKREKES